MTTKKNNTKIITNYRFRGYNSRNLGLIKISVFILIFALLVSNSIAQPEIPTITAYATDQTGTLSTNEINQLNKALAMFEDSTSTQIVFLMIPSLDNYSLEMYAYETAAKNKIGTKGNNNGVLFLVSKNDRKMRIEVGYGLEGALPDALASSIIRNEVTPYFKQGNYTDGIIVGLRSIILATQGEYHQTRRNRSDDEKNSLGSLIPLIVFIIIFILSRKGGRGGRGGGLFYIGGFGGSGGFSSGGGSGFGGFSGGGGSFGGGGASGGW